MIRDYGNGQSGGGITGLQGVSSEAAGTYLHAKYVNSIKEYFRNKRIFGKSDAEMISFAERIWSKDKLNDLKFYLETGRTDFKNNPLNK